MPASIYEESVDLPREPDSLGAGTAADTDRRCPSRRTPSSSRSAEFTSTGMAVGRCSNGRLVGVASAAPTPWWSGRRGPVWRDSRRSRLRKAVKRPTVAGHRVLGRHHTLLRRRRPPSTARWTVRSVICAFVGEELIARIVEAETWWSPGRAGTPPGKCGTSRPGCTGCGGRGSDRFAVDDLRRGHYSRQPQVPHATRRLSHRPAYAGTRLGPAHRVIR